MEPYVKHDKLNDLERSEKPNPDASDNLPPLSSDTIYQVFAQHSNMLKNIAKTQSEDGKKDIELNHVLFTKPIKDSEGRIIEPSRLVAIPCNYYPNFELQMLFDSLPKNQQEVFIQVMREAVDKLNTNKDIQKSENRKKDIELNHVLFTKPIKDSEGRIIEPSRLVAIPCNYYPNFELQMLIDSLPENQREFFLQVMREAVDKLNTNKDIKYGRKQ